MGSARRHHAYLQLVFEVEVARWNVQNEHEVIFEMALFSIIMPVLLSPDNPVPVRSNNIYSIPEFAAFASSTVIRFSSPSPA